MKSAILPAPQIEEYGQTEIFLSNQNEPFYVRLKGFNESSVPLSEGLEWFSKRLKYLGGGDLEVTDSIQEAQADIEWTTDQKLTNIIRKKGILQTFTPKILSQAYILKVTGPTDGVPAVSIKATDELGVYYALVTLCQLVGQNDSGEIILPEVEIMDWPHIGLRLGKASASDNTLSALQKFYRWMPFYKINMVGLQFHGEESREPGRFRDNIEAICPQQRQRGLVETIVYYCPFRGKGYDFRSESDKKEYADLIDWVFDQGAHGLEVDYNDWGVEVDDLPPEDVVTMAWQRVRKNDPDAYVLYCAPNKGPARYKGEASEELVHILSNIPDDVWPIWVGLESLLDYKLEVEDIENWIKATGRKPFFWLNRVSIGADLSLARSVDGDTNKMVLPGGVTRGLQPYVLDGDTSRLVLPGERLPIDLNRYFQGIHLNYPFGVQKHYKNRKGYQFPIPEHIPAKELIYFATVADYIWNPDAWEAHGSYHRARQFVEIMKPLIEYK